MFGPKVKVIHQGRGGYVEYKNQKFSIEHVNEGHFCIHFQKNESQTSKCLAELKKFADSQVPKWYVEEH
jgi:hypothetical protein